VINDKSQGSVSAHLRYGELFSHQSTVYLSLSFVVKFSDIGEDLVILY